MQDFERLATQVERLEARLGQMKRQRIAGAVLLAAVVGGSAFNMAPQDLTVRSLAVIGADGKRQVFLIGDENGGQLNVYSSEGRRAVALGVDKGAGFADWYAPDGGRTATVFTSENESGRFQFFNGTGQPIAVVGADTQGGFFNVRTHEGKIASYMEIDTHTNGIFGVYAGKDGKRRAIIGVDDRGIGAVQVFDAEGKARGRLP